MTSRPAPTLSDVAEHAGVSLATASRALNGSVRQVGPDLKAKVIESANALGYSVNAHAQAVAKGASGTVALVVGDISDPYFSSIAAGVVRESRSHGLAVTLNGLETSPVGDSGDRERALIASLQAQRPRAVIVAAGRDSDADWDLFGRLEGLTVIGPSPSRCLRWPAVPKRPSTSLGAGLSRSAQNSPECTAPFADERSKTLEIDSESLGGVATELTPTGRH